MRNRIIVASLALVIIVASAVFYIHSGSSPVWAQGSDLRPIMVNEIVHQWCDTATTQICASATFQSFEDGSIHVVFSSQTDVIHCPEGITFPRNVDGFAYSTNAGGIVQNIALLAGQPSPPICEFTAHRIS